VEQRAFAVSEYGLNSVISGWNRAWNLTSAFPVGSIDSSKVYVAAQDTAWAKVSRLTDNTFLVVSEGRASIGSASLESRRQTSAYVRIAYPSITPKGAITAAGDVKLQGSALVDGDDLNPSGWTHCPASPSPTVPAVVVPPGSSVDYQAKNIGSTPAVVYDPAAADSNTYVRYGSETWVTLTSNADIKMPGGNYNSDIEPTLSGSACDRSGIYNWGEPLRPGVVACQGYYPIIYATGSIHLNGNGRGQGILLVNGDLEINGKFEFYGLVIVRDDVTKGNGTAKIHGALYAANLTLTDPLSWITGNQDVFYSKCAVETALAGSAILVRVLERGWAQVF
jgi:hypothetical protein